MYDKPVTQPSLERGVVFQSHALLPWLTVGKNIGFALKAKTPNLSVAETNRQIDFYLGMVGLAKVKDKTKPIIRRYEAACGHCARFCDKT